MATYQANGAQLGWLLIPEQRAVEAATQLETGPLFPGLQIELQEIWEV